MNVVAKLTRAQRRTLVLLACVAALLEVTQASAVKIPATVTGTAEYLYELYGTQGYYKYPGALVFSYFSSNYVFCVNRAYLKFDLSALPDTCTLVSADLNYFQYDSPDGTTHVYLKIISDPEPQDAQSLYSQIGSAETWGSRQSPDGLESLPFSGSALPVLDSCRRAGSISLGLCSSQDHPQYGDGGAAYGRDGAFPPYLRFTYLGVNEIATDIQALRAELATYPLGAQRPDTALLVLTNKGITASGPFWAHVSSPSLATDSALVEPIAVGETRSVFVPLPSPPSREAMTDYRLWASDDNDWHHDNDSAEFSCWAFPASTYAAEGFDGSAFPPPGWTAASGDGGTHGWTRQTETGRSHSGGGFALCVSESTGSSDDWLTSGPLYPTRDYQDSVGFFVNRTANHTPDTLEVWAISSNHSPIRLLLLAVGGLAYRHQSLSLDGLDGDTIKVAFRSCALFNGSDLRLDDIRFSRVYSPDTTDTTDTSHVEPPQRDVVQRTSIKLPVLAFAPNPANHNLVTVRSALAVG